MGHHNREVDDMTTQFRNDVLLEGIPSSQPEWSHENHGTQFYRFFLQVPRLSGTPDTLPVLLPEALLPQVQNQALRVQGQLRSFNNRSGVGSRLVLTVYAQTLAPGTGELCNHIALSGSLCKAPIFRRTPLGRSICDVMLAVPRRYGRADYLPVIAWGSWPPRSAACGSAIRCPWRDGFRAGSTRKSPMPAPRSAPPTRCPSCAWPPVPTPPEPDTAHLGT